MPGNMFISPPQQRSNPIMGLLGQLALMKVQHDWSMEEKQLALEAKKVEAQEAKAEVRSSERSKAMMEGATFETPSGPVASPTAYQQSPGSYYDPRYGQNVKPPQPEVVNVDGNKFLQYGGKLTPVKQGEDSIKGPATIQNFELVKYGKAVPELRGTPQYQNDYMQHIMTTKEQNPMLDWTSKQYEMNRQKEAAGLRTEFSALPEVKNYIDISSKKDIMAEALAESKVSGNHVATDQVLITMFNKMTDPQSVVRESEYARTKEDLSIMNRLKGTIEKWQKGGPGLTNDDREALQKMANKFADVSEKKYKDRLKEYHGYYTSIGFNPNQYLAPYGSQAASPPSVPPKGNTANRPPLSSFQVK